MISFSWTPTGPAQFLLEVQTPVTRIGTLYRLTAAIYDAGLDIFSGDINTVKIDSEVYSSDRFFLRKVEGYNGEIDDTGHQLGMLMETLLSDRNDPETLLQEHGKKLPSAEEMVQRDAELVFEQTKDHSETRMYIETYSRTGFLLHMSRILYLEGLNISAATIRTTHAGIAQDYFHLQENGRALSDERCDYLTSLILLNDSEKFV